MTDKLSYRADKLPMNCSLDCEHRIIIIKCVIFLLHWRDVWDSLKILVAYKGRFEDIQTTIGEEALPLPRTLDSPASEHFSEQL